MPVPHPERFMPSSTPPWGWQRIASVHSSEAHAMPTWDLFQHQFSPDCPCGPIVDVESGDFFHNSFDGREPYETGEAKHH